MPCQIRLVALTCWGAEKSQRDLDERQERCRRLGPEAEDMRLVQAAGPPIWIGGASEAAMRRVGRSGTGWLGFEGLPDEVADHLWSIARRAAQDAGRDPDALKTAMRINFKPGTSADSLAGKLARLIVLDLHYVTTRAWPRAAESIAQATDVSRRRL